VHEDGTTVTIALDRDRSGFDGTPLVTDVPQHAGENTVRVDAADLTPGRYWVQLTSTDAHGTSQVYSTGPLLVTPRYAGGTRVETSVALSQGAFADGADTAVLAVSDEYADALAASQLAFALDAPILLVRPSTLDRSVATELRRLGVSSVVVAGGPAAISDAVVDAVRAVVPDTHRVWGPDRYATAAALADEAVSVWKKDGHEVADRVLLASGVSFPDGLAASQLIAATHTPLLLTPTDGPAVAALEGVDALDPSQVVALGGPAAVSDDVLAAVAAGRTTDRLAGRDRFETAVAIRDAAIAAGADAGVTVLCSGRTFADALSASSLVGRRFGTMVLVEPDELPDAVAAALRPAQDGHDSAAAGTPWIRTAGGHLAVSDQVVVDALRAAGLTYP
jgi:putative cell wall-binding protein